MPVCFTVSRNASAASRDFARQLASRFPCSDFESRGDLSLEEKVARARFAGFTRLIVVTEQRGQPTELRVVAVDENGWRYRGRVAVKLERAAEKDSLKEKSQPAALSLSIQDRKLRAFFLDWVGPEAVDEAAPLSLKEDGGALSFFCGPIEVGPRFSLGDV